MKSQGTKETQGINGDAALLQHKLEAAAGVITRDSEPCPYPDHRPTDWRLKIQTDGTPADEGSRWTCGACYPPASGLDVEREAVMA
jgi:hypothetical protein